MKYPVPPVMMVRQPCGNTGSVLRYEALRSAWKVQIYTMKALLDLLYAHHLSVLVQTGRRAPCL
jgi:hypothetical protein